MLLGLVLSLLGSVAAYYLIRGRAALPSLGDRPDPDALGLWSVQDVGPTAGREAAWERTYARLRPHVSAFVDAARRWGIDSRVLLAIALVESAGDPNAVGDGGHAHGLMQVHDRAWPDMVRAWRAAGSTIEGNVDMGARVLRLALDHPKIRALPARDRLRAGVAAYNTGVGNVSRSLAAGRDVDSTTAGGGYSRSVLSRALWLADRGTA